MDADIAKQLKAPVGSGGVEVGSVGQVGQILHKVNVGPVSKADAEDAKKKLEEAGAGVEVK